LGLANWLTIFRIVLIPIFISLLVYGQVTIALGVFCLASLTDILDGYIARHRGRPTRLGAFLDPMADKLLLTASFITLTYLKALPFWITALVISRDLLLILGSALVHMTGGQVHPAPTLAGKASTLFQMATVFVAIFTQSLQLNRWVLTVLIWATAALTLSSGLQYLYVGSRYLNGQPSMKSL
jgi:cardiolipin synthase